MKTCSKCKIEKSLDSFHKNRAQKDGLANQCKSCCRIYRTSEAGREMQKRSMKKYGKTAGGKEAQRRANLKRMLKSPKKIKARQALSDAIAAGKIARGPTCEGCKNKDFTEGHHPDYSKPLDVDWLCTECHTELHRKERLCT